MSPKKGSDQDFNEAEVSNIGPSFFKLDQELEDSDNDEFSLVLRPERIKNEEQKLNSHERNSSSSEELIDDEPVAESSPFKNLRLKK